jgi:hypothetical protein
MPIIATTAVDERHFFVDEAGDGSLYDKHGKCIVGQPGCSRFFIIGTIEVTEPQRLARELEDLRSELLKDPWFKRVPTMQKADKKTALLFHAKDDLPEVRREVFALLRTHEIKFSAAVRNKVLIEKSVQIRNQKEPGYRYHQNELYDWTVSHTFTGLLDNNRTYNVVFASRGNSSRTKALTEALKRVPCPVNGQVVIQQIPPVLNIQAVPSKQNTQLQAADYFLWALQRFYEVREERFVELMWPQFRTVKYLHPSVKDPIQYGATKPLTLEAIQGLSNMAPPPAPRR